jgi:hypothetical protein
MPGACSARRPATAPWSWRLKAAVVQAVQIRCRFSVNYFPLRGCWPGTSLNSGFFRQLCPFLSLAVGRPAGRDSAGVERFAPGGGANRPRGVERIAPGGWSESPQGGGAIRPSRPGPYGWDRPLPRQFRIPRTSPAGRETQSSARRPGLDPARGEPPRSGPERVAQAGRARARGLRAGGGMPSWPGRGSQSGPARWPSRRRSRRTSWGGTIEPVNAPDGPAACSGRGRNRTGDTRIFSPLLYQLSYPSSGMNLVRTVTWRDCQ